MGIAGHGTLDNGKINMHKMNTLKIASYQMNATVGDLIGNTDKLINQINLAIKQKADIFIALELAISGYPPEDLLLREGFYRSCHKQLDRILKVDGITMLIGCPYRIGTDSFNSLFVISWSL